MEMFDENGTLKLPKDAFMNGKTPVNALTKGWSYKKNNSAYCRSCDRLATYKPVDCKSVGHHQSYQRHLERNKQRRREIE